MYFFVVVRTVLQSKLRSAITAEMATFLTVCVGSVFALPEVLHLSKKKKKKVGNLFTRNCRPMEYLLLTRKHAVMKMLPMETKLMLITKYFLYAAVEIIL